VGLARFSTLFLAAVLASPALYAGFWTHTLDMQTALLRYLIAVPVAAVMLGIVRAVTRGYGQRKEQPTVRAEAITGEPIHTRRTDDSG
jgi:hypothetical protein